MEFVSWFWRNSDDTFRKYGVYYSPLEITGRGKRWGRGIWMSFSTDDTGDIWKAVDDLQNDES